MDKKNRQLYLDVLRIISMAAVVVIHTAAQYWHALDVSSPEWQVETVYDGLVRWAVPVFVMISGALFLNPEKPQPLRKLFGKNILRIVTVILFWGCVYALLSGLPADLSLPSLLTFAKTTVFGHYHMWFLYMIIGLYLVTPILRALTRERSVMRYFLVISFALNCLIPFLGSFGRLSSLQTLVSMFEIQVPLGYAFYFVLGYFLNTVELSPRRCVTAGALGIVGLILTVVLTLWQSAVHGVPVTAFFDNFSLPVCLTSSGLFVTARYLGGRLTTSTRAGKGVTALSSCTLGVYLVHAALLEKLQECGITTLSFDPLFSIPVITFGVILASFAVTFVLRRIPIARTYFV